MLTRAAWQSRRTLEPSRAKYKLEGYGVNYLVFRSNIKAVLSERRVTSKFFCIKDVAYLLIH